MRSYALRRNQDGARRIDSLNRWYYASAGDRGKDVGFREVLPEGCPPDEAHTGACAPAFRLVANKPPIDADFASAAARQEPLPANVSPCRWASCSLFVSISVIHKKRQTFKKLRKYPYAAEMNIVAESGWIAQDGAHIDFWMSDTFDPLASVVNVVVL